MQIYDINVGAYIFILNQNYRIHMVVESFKKCHAHIMRNENEVTILRGTLKEVNYNIRIKVLDIPKSKSLCIKLV